MAKPTVLIAAFLLVTAVPSALADTPSWRVQKVSGKAWIGTNSATGIYLTADMVLPDGATLFTAKDSRVMLVRGTDTMLVGPGSVIAVRPQATAGLTTTILERSGTAEFDVDRQNVKHFSVETPYLAAVVKGTHFVVRVDRRQANVAVGRGEVAVTDLKTGQMADVRPGQSANVLRNGSGMAVAGSGTRPVIVPGVPRPPLITPLAAVSSANILDAAAGAPTDAALAATVTSASVTRQATAVSGNAPGLKASTGSNSAVASPTASTATSVATIVSVSTGQSATGTSGSTGVAGSTGTSGSTGSSGSASGSTTSGSENTGTQAGTGGSQNRHHTHGYVGLGLIGALLGHGFDHSGSNNRTSGSDHGNSGNSGSNGSNGNGNSNNGSSNGTGTDSNSSDNSSGNSSGSGSSAGGTTGFGHFHLGGFSLGAGNSLGGRFGIGRH